jgi:hypothetical protein
MNSRKIFSIIPLIFFLTFIGLAQQHYYLIPQENLEGVNAVEVDGIVKVKLEQGEQMALYYDGSDSLDAKIKAIVKNKVLSISSTQAGGTIYLVHKGLNSIKMTAAVEVNSVNMITSPRLNVSMTGACESYLELDVTELMASVSGASTLHLKGKADTAFLKLSGASSYNAAELVTVKTEALISGASQAQVNASEQLVAKVSGMSSISYANEPKTVDIEKSGSSEVVLGGLDTLQVKIGGQRVIIIEDIEEEIEKHLEEPEEKEPRFNGHWGGLELHLNTYMSPDYKIEVADPYGFLNPDLMRSFGLNINLIEKSIPLTKKYLGLVTGLGWTYNNYRFDNDIVLLNDTSVIWAYSDDRYQKSKLRVNSLTIPVILEFQTNEKDNLNSLHIGAGMIFGLNVGARTKNVYFDDSERIKYKQRGDFHLNPISAAATARIGWGKLNLFASYDLLPLFKAGEGPELYPVQVGITLVDW